MLSNEKKLGAARRPGRLFVGVALMATIPLQWVGGHSVAQGDPLVNPTSPGRSFPGGTTRGSEGVGQSLSYS